LPGAWDAFATANRRGDPHGRALYDMGLVRERQGQFAAALELYQRSLALPDQPPQAIQRRLGIARSLLGLGRRSEAEAEFAAAERAAGNRAVVTLEHAAAWLRCGDAGRALAVLDADSLAAASAAGLRLRVRALRSLGRETEAVQAEQRTHSLAPAQALAADKEGALGGPAGDAAPGSLPADRP
jgi:tetratricopeptide (TPR) repeat protein